MGSLIHTFMLLFVAYGVFLMVATVPMIWRCIKPNALYGFRIPKTLSNEEIWYDANAYAGRLMFAAGAAQAFAAVAFVFVPGVGKNLTAYCLLCGAVTLGTIQFVTWLSKRYANAL